MVNPGDTAAYNSLKNQIASWNNVFDNLINKMNNNTLDFDTATRNMILAQDFLAMVFGTIDDFKTVEASDSVYTTYAAVLLAKASTLMNKVNTISIWTGEECGYIPVIESGLAKIVTTLTPDIDLMKSYWGGFWEEHRTIIIAIIVIYVGLNVYSLIK